MRPLLIVLGCRPEAIKTAPVIREATRRKWNVTVVVTGQHKRLFDDTGFPQEFQPEYLGVANFGDPDAYVDAVVERLQSWVYEHPEHVVLVQGDTASAYAGGMWAHAMGWPLVHLEAGLRTHDILDPWPEEKYRVRLDTWARLRLAPTPTALKALHDEGLVAGSLLVGNTVVDALRALEVRYIPRCLRAPTVIITLHRRESWDSKLRDIMEGVSAVAAEHCGPRGLLFRWPAHPAPAVQAVAERWHERQAKRRMDGGNIVVEEPWAYPRFIRTLAYARAVVTDSGGVIEEAATLGVPCVIARDKTERPEAIAAGHALLAGRTADGVATALRSALAGELSERPSQVFGDGSAAVQSCNAIEEMLR